MLKKLICLMLCVGQMASAEVVILQGPNTSNLEYSAYLKVNSDRISPQQKYLKDHPLSETRTDLVQKFASAQREFLSGSLENAKVAFSKVVELLYMDDWKKSDLEIFLFSMLRLAQLSTQQDEVELWLNRSLTIPQDVSIDPHLFPPPLLDQRNRLLVSLKKITAEWSPDLANFKILINGLEFVPTEPTHLALYPGRYRVTYLSNSVSAETRIMNAEQIATFSPNLQPLFLGHCESLKSLWPGNEPSEVFGGEKCNSPDISRKALVNLNITKNESARNSGFDPAVGLQSQMPTPFYKRGWFWLGVGSVVVASLALSEKDKKNESKSSTTYGF